MNAECPYCGQRMLVRHGVQLSPREADILQLIEIPGGIEMKELAKLMAPDKPVKVGLKLMAVHVYHINNKLWEVGLCIEAGSLTKKYRLTKRNGVGKDGEPLRVNASFPGS